MRLTEADHAELIFAAADPDLAAELAADDPDRVTDAVVTELAGRAALLPGPSHPVAVQLEIGTATGTRRFLLNTGPGGVSVEPGSSDQPWVRFRQELPELLGCVYGPAGAPALTRSVAVRDTPGPTSVGDPWLMLWQAAGIAAGQVVKACDYSPSDLDALALSFGSDKWGGHRYTPHYARHLAPYRERPVRLLEIGVGGYGSPTAGGASLRMWKHYFRRGLIYGLDIVDKSGLDEPRMQTVQGDQSDPAFLAELAARVGPFDVVIDDGSHLSDHIISSFHALFPLLRVGGLYVIEDLATSYWPNWNGGRTGSDDSGTSIGFLKTLIDGLHHQEHDRSVEEDIVRSVAALHFYPEIVFVAKGANNGQPAPAWLRGD